MKRLKLTKGYVALVDDEDFARVSQFKWCTFIKRRRDGSVLSKYAVRGAQKSEATQNKIQMHRFILSLAKEDPDVDHKDRDGLNNQRYNLRVDEDGNNIRNQNVRVDNKSGFKGVSWDTEKKKWRVVLTLKDKQLFIGRFDCLLEAAHEYDMYAVKHFGEFAHCNFAIPN